MPRANQDRYNPLGRVPRTLFSHAHRDGNSEFPPELSAGATGETFLLMPDNFNGLDKLVVWLLGFGDQSSTIDVTINIATCDEAFNVHTQTVNNINVTVVNNEYECVDLTATFAAVLANLAARDMVWLTLTAAVDFAIYFIGTEIQET